jgi:hypothetical protein
MGRNAELEAEIQDILDQVQRLQRTSMLEVDACIRLANTLRNCAARADAAKQTSGANQLRQLADNLDNQLRTSSA